MNIKEDKQGLIWIKGFSEYAILQMKRGQHILEVGCGNGRDAVFFASSGIKVDAIDRTIIVGNWFYGSFLFFMSGLNFWLATTWPFAIPLPLFGPSNGVL